jgi:hypothetical protein
MDNANMDFERLYHQEKAARERLETRYIESQLKMSYIAKGGSPKKDKPFAFSLGASKLVSLDDNGNFQFRGQPATPNEIIDDLRLDPAWKLFFDDRNSKTPEAESGPMRIPAGDPELLGRHAKDVATGRVVVDYNSPQNSAPKSSASPKTIPRGNSELFGKYVTEIASGEITVVG